MNKIYSKGNKFRDIGMLVLLLSLLIAVGCKNGTKSESTQEDDLVAKKTIQGIWTNDLDGSSALYIKGDSLYYPDPQSEPAKFHIANDTLYVESSHPTKYHLIKFTHDLLKFTAENGDETTLVKSKDKSLLADFGINLKKPSEINQGKLIKKDTIVSVGETRMHAYIQVNPTSYKVFRPYMNDDGVSVDHIYYDNIIHVALFNGAKSVLNRDYHKQDFKGLVDKGYISQSILSDIVVDHVTPDAVCFVAILTTPETDISYNVNISVSADGKVHLSL